MRKDKIISFGQIMRNFKTTGCSLSKSEINEMGLLMRKIFDGFELDSHEVRRLDGLMLGFDWRMSSPTLWQIKSHCEDYIMLNSPEVIENVY